MCQVRKKSTPSLTDGLIAGYIRVKSTRASRAPEIAPAAAKKLTIGQPSFFAFFFFFLFVQGNFLTRNIIIVLDGKKKKNINGLTFEVYVKRSKVHLLTMAAGQRIINYSFPRFYDLTSFLLQHIFHSTRV